MLTPVELAQAREYATKWQAMGGKAKDTSAVLLALLEHIDAITTHNRVMQAALAQFANKDNWVYTPAQTDEVGRVEFRAVWEWDGENDPQPMALDVLDSINSQPPTAERALVGDGLVDHSTIDNV